MSVWPPRGYINRWQPDRDWRVLPEGTTKKCRMLEHRKRCPEVAVAELNRGIRRHVRGGRADSWWAYCSKHLYGRRIKDGLVEVGGLRKRGKI